MNDPTLALHPSRDGLLDIGRRVGRRTRAQRTLSHASLAGLNQSASPGRGIDFRESRPYQPGDDVRAIDWRLSARTGKVYTKVYEESRDLAVLLALDLHPAQYFGTRRTSKATAAAELCAALGYASVRHGDRVGLLRGGQAIHAIRPSTGKRGLLRLIDGLCAAPGPQLPTAELLDELPRLTRPGMLVVLVTTAQALLPLPEQLERIKRVARRAPLRVVLMRDALERTLPPPGRYPITDGGRHAVIDLTRADVRDACSRSLIGHADAVRDGLRAAGLAVHELAPEDDPVQWVDPLLSRRRR